MKITVRGLQRAQAMNKRAIEAVKPSGALGRALQYMVLETHRYIIKITHRITGALASSRRMSIDYGAMRGIVFTSPSARNPRSGALTSEYDVYEEARGGSHAAWQRTKTEVGDKVLHHGISMVIEGIR